MKKKLMTSSFCVVKEKQTGEFLFHCPIEEMESAYEFCRKMEELGVLVHLHIPSAPETLLTSLGRKDTDIEELRCEIESEISDHND